MNDKRLLVKLNDAEESISKVERLVEADANFEQLIEALAETRAFVEGAGWLLLSHELHNCMGSKDSIDDHRVIDVIRRLFGSPPVEERDE